MGLTDQSQRPSTADCLHPRAAFIIPNQERGDGYVRCFECGQVWSQPEWWDILVTLGFNRVKA